LHRLFFIELHGVFGVNNFLELSRSEEIENTHYQWLSIISARTPTHICSQRESLKDSKIKTGRKAAAAATATTTFVCLDLFCL
jgi:hypothetical protein